MSWRVRFSLLLTGLFFLSLYPVAVRAQESTGKTMTNPHSVTGCLQKGTESGGFYIVEGDKMWELTGKVDAAHVGHKVTVSGHVLHRSKMQEAKYEDSEKQEANGKSYADFQVTSLKMVSETCP
jgi:hypothetical protein